ncbi:unnamed protein product [Blepharisma stoltei]|uniref:Uncharacterized protein n=1 Tax=Blepharisma stoltei TaxID=1481888 RepID=A0AAU9IWH5_9CILI|nr:unnamed protein product [Blepharisma stoltei]
MKLSIPANESQNRLLLKDIDIPLCPEDLYGQEESNPNIFESTIPIHAFAEPNLNLYSSSRPVTAPTTRRHNLRPNKQAQKVSDIMNMTFTSPKSSIESRSQLCDSLRFKPMNLSRLSRNCRSASKTRDSVNINKQSMHPKVKLMRGYHKNDEELIDNKELYQIAKSKSIEAILKLNSKNPESIGVAVLQLEKEEQVHKPKIKPTLAESRGNSPLRDTQKLSDFALEIKNKIWNRKNTANNPETSQKVLKKEENEEIWNLSTQEDTESGYKAARYEGVSVLSKILLQQRSQLHYFEASLDWLPCPQSPKHSSRPGTQASPTNRYKDLQRPATQSPRKSFKTFQIFENEPQNIIESTRISPFARQFIPKTPKKSNKDIITVIPKKYYFGSKAHI